MQKLAITYKLIKKSLTCKIHCDNQNIWHQFHKIPRRSTLTFQIIDGDWKSNCFLKSLRVRLIRFSGVIISKGVRFSKGTQINDTLISHWVWQIIPQSWHLRQLFPNLNLFSQAAHFSFKANFVTKLWFRVGVEVLLGFTVFGEFCLICRDFCTISLSSCGVFIWWVFCTISIISSGDFMIAWSWVEVFAII